MLLKIILAGGCFWSMQIPFDKLKSEGVKSVIVGFSGGYKKNPTYNDVVGGGTQHREVVEVTYDPAKIKLERILDVYWTHIDPLNEHGQFCDSGDQYHSAIFQKDSGPLSDSLRGRRQCTSLLYNHECRESELQRRPTLSSRFSES